MGLPDDLPGPGTNPYWTEGIGEAYGAQHPLVISTTNFEYGDRAINLRVQYGVGGMGGPNFRDPDDYDMEVSVGHAVVPSMSLRALVH